MARRRVLALALAVAAVSGCGASPPQAPVGRDVRVRLAGCHVTVDIVRADQRRIRALVPKRYALGGYAGPGRATVVFWVLACDSMRTGGGLPRPAIVSLVGVQVRPPTEPRPVAPATFDHYLLTSQTDDPELARALRRAGLPAELVPGIRFRRGRVASTRIPWRRGGYRVSVRGSGHQPPHDHDNYYWHDGAAGASRLEVRLFDATDRACGGCAVGGVVTTAGGPIASILGTTSVRPYIGFDHNKIARGDATVFAPRKLSFRSAAPEGFLGVLGTAGRRDGVAGVVVTGLVFGQAAERAGIRQGDLIVSVNGTRVRDQAALAATVSRIAPGSRVALTIARQGDVEEVTATLGLQ